MGNEAWRMFFDWSSTKKKEIVGSSKNIGMHKQTFFILLCLYQFTCSTKRPLFGWGNANQTSNKNSNNKSNNTNNEYGHSTNKQTLDKKLCDELVTFTPNLCSIYGAKVRCTIHCKLPTGLLKSKVLLFKTRTLFREISGEFF